MFRPICPVSAAATAADGRDEISGIRIEQRLHGEERVDLCGDGQRNPATLGQRRERMARETRLGRQQQRQPLEIGKQNLLPSHHLSPGKPRARQADEIRVVLANRLMVRAGGTPLRRNTAISVSPFSSASSIWLL